MSHANARTTVHGRLLIVARHRQGWPQAHIAKAMGISRGCVKKWIDRYDQHGEIGMVDRSSRPHRCPRATNAEIEAEVVGLRESSWRGREWIAQQTGVPARTVSKILARHHMPPLAALDPMTGVVIRSSKATAVRYERDHPGELVHMDVKKVGRIPDGGGWRAHGRGVGADRERETRVGYDYVHSVADDHSRLAYSDDLGQRHHLPHPVGRQRGLPRPRHGAARAAPGTREAGPGLPRLAGHAVHDRDVQRPGRRRRRGLLSGARPHRTRHGPGEVGRSAHRVEGDRPVHPGTAPPAPVRAPAGRGRPRPAGGRGRGDWRCSASCRPP